MTPYVVSQLPPADIELWKRIRAAVEALPDFDIRNDKDEKVELSCHILARAVSTTFGLGFYDGFYRSPGFDHSWIVTSSGNVIDVYPIGTLGGPLLIDAFISRELNLYCPMSLGKVEEHFGKKFNSEWFKKAVVEVRSKLQETSK